MPQRLVRPALLALLGLAPLVAVGAQQPAVPPPQPVAPNQHTLIPFPNRQKIPAGALELMKLEGDFQNAVAKGGGKAFASWFAEDGMTLNNGQPAVMGQRAISAQATWDPQTYQLTWFPEGAQVGPSGDTGFTWGHYDAQGKNAKGEPLTSSGRYITFWKKVNGHWKVALDASANDAPEGPALP
jgi:ketosteroid isomerase-like protein